jgi:uncharacterized damage-inducible protein DinB
MPAGTCDPRYPIGPYQAEAASNPERRAELLAGLAAAAGRLGAAVQGLSPAELDTPYRDGGWTARQVVHHLADAHLNWYVRTRLALTEGNPVIKPYAEALWAELPDARQAAVEPSLALLGAVHVRWVRLMEALTEADWRRTMAHPERGELTLAALLPMHVWHARHHTAQVSALRRRLRDGIG